MKKNERKIIKYTLLESELKEKLGVKGRINYIQRNLEHLSRMWEIEVEE